MTIKIDTGRQCACCGNLEAFIAIGKQEGNRSFADLVSNQVCWECWVAVIHPVDRKLANAEARAKSVFNRPGSYLHSGQYRRDLRNIAAWKEAIQHKALQRQLYGVE